MTPAEYTELRQSIDRCLDGVERAEDVAARFFELMALYWEANHQASRGKGHALPDCLWRTQLSPEKKRRLVALFEASLGKSMRKCGRLPQDDAGTAQHEVAADSI